jgi:hypothetical protein
MALMGEVARESCERRQHKNYMGTNDTKVV